jgi:hypothetical protein
VEARDHAADGDLRLGISVLPSRLPQAFAAVEELGPRALMADTYRASLRLNADAADAQSVGRLRARIEAIGGVLFAQAAPGVDGYANVRALASSVPAAAAALTKSLEQVFDPKGALWPCRP